MSVFLNWAPCSVYGEHLHVETVVIEKPRSLTLLYQHQHQCDYGFRFCNKCVTSENAMGNCLKRSTTDDISLLRSSDSVRDSSSDQLGPPAYQESLPSVTVASVTVTAPTATQASSPVYHPSPSVTRSVAQLTEEEQVKIAKRIGLIQHLPTGLYDGCKKARECVICMVEFHVGDALRYLPCMHTYHMSCIDDWLMRSLTCPSCMEPVDAALLTSYETN